MKNKTQLHEFALYEANVDIAIMEVGQQFVIMEDPLVHRIARVLRLHPDDTLIIFDRMMHAHVIIKTIHKQSVTVEIVRVNKNRVLEPYVCVYLPLLKREALEQAIYSVVELGANEVQLMHTAKVQRAWHQSDYARLQHIMIAAAEQSKNFSIPIIHAPVPISEMIFSRNTLFFDSDGVSLVDALQQIDKQKQRYAMLVGPEGDLTEAEKFYLQRQGVLFAKLTPTILRAQQAVAIGLGFLRSMI